MHHKIFKSGSLLSLVSLLIYSVSLMAQTINTEMTRVSTGVVIPDREVTVATKIMGRVETVAYEEGQFVRRGDLLIKLDDSELQAELNSAMASAALAKAELDHQKRRKARLQRLYKNRSISEDDLDTALLAAATAAAKLRIAESAIEKTQVLLRETEIRAPFDATIIEKLIETGAVTQPGTPLLRLEDQKQLKFRTRIKESDIAHLKTGKTVSITIDALDNLKLEGSISKLIPSGDKETHTFIIEIDLPEKAGLYPGMFGKATF